MTQDYLMTRPARPFNVHVPSPNSIIDKTIQIQLQIFILGPSQSQTKYTCFTHYVPCIPWASVQLYCACNTVLLHNFEGGGRGGPKSFLGKSPLFPQEIIYHFPKSHITNIIHDAQNSILITNYSPKWRPFWVYNIDVIWE